MINSFFFGDTLLIESVKNRDVRKRIFNSLELTDSAREYFAEQYNNSNWSSILYNGKWEKTFVFFSKVVRKIIGERVVEELFSFDDVEEQKEYIQNRFPKLKWKILMTILGNKPLFNALLYKGDFIKKNVEDSYLQYYTKAFDHLMTHDLAKTSFFLQLCFLGEIRHKEGNLVEASEECFNSMKKSLNKAEIHFHKQDIISAIKNEKNVDFISISDVPSYFSGDVEKNFFQDIRPSLSTRGIVVNRNYLRVPIANRSNYQDVTNNYLRELSDEKVQMYRIEVLQNATN
jgi:S-adenosylmethionine-diacylglycerol 3-amino-3-carboxypropyl transferase